MENNKKAWVWVSIAAGVLVIGIAAWYFLAGSGSTVAVPDIVGMKAGDAVRASRTPV